MMVRKEMKNPIPRLLPRLPHGQRQRLVSPARRHQLPVHPAGPVPFWQRRVERPPDPEMLPEILPAVYQFHIQKEFF